MKLVIGGTASILDRKTSRDVVASSSIDIIKRRDQILNLPTQLFSPYRLLILAALWREGELDFKSLKEDIKEISEGNLSSHLRKLEELALIKVNKEFVNKRPRTSYKLNNVGRKRFLELVHSLRDSLDDIK